MDDQVDNERQWYIDMADLCQQCSIEIYGEDSRDLAELTNPPNAWVTIEDRPHIQGYEVLCEGCGPTLVDREGRCLLHDHETKEAQIHHAISI